MPNLDQNPGSGNVMRAAGSSEIYKYGMSPDSRAVLSQKIRLLTPTYGDNTGARYQLASVILAVVEILKLLEVSALGIL